MNAHAEPPYDELIRALKRERTATRKCLENILQEAEIRVIQSHHHRLPVIKEESCISNESLIQESDCNFDLDQTDEQDKNTLI